MQLFWDFQFDIYHLNIRFVVIVQNRSISASSDILCSSILMMKQPIYDVFTTISISSFVNTKSDYLLVVLRCFSTVYRLRTLIQLENIHNRSVNFIIFFINKKHLEWIVSARTQVINFVEILFVVLSTDKKLFWCSVASSLSSFHKEYSYLMYMCDGWNTPPLFFHISRYPSMAAAGFPTIEQIPKVHRIEYIHITYLKLWNSAMRQMYSRFLALIGKANHKHHSICLIFLAIKSREKINTKSVWTLWTLICIFKSPAEYNECIIAIAI